MTPEITAATDEAVLVALAQAGDETAFAELMRRNVGTSMRLAVSLLRDREEAEDQVQTAFLKAWQHLKTFQSESRFSTWFKSIVRNQSLMRLRSLRNRKYESLDAPTATGAPREISSVELSAEEVLGQTQMHARLREELGRLPGPMRQAIELRDVEQLSMEEAAERLEISVPALKSRLHRARAMLRERMERHMEWAGAAHEY